MQNKPELVILVDTNDNEIGVMDKYEAHRNPAKLHRAISVFLFNKDGQLLIQKRSQQKIVGALQWANTCCGNLWPGETYEKCAYRRLKYELGITEVTLTQVSKFQYAVQCNEEYGEHEMDTVFVGRYDGKVKPNPEEVADYRWMNLPNFNDSSNLEFQNYKWAPWFEIMMEKADLRTMIQEWLESNK